MDNIKLTNEQFDEFIDICESPKPVGLKIKDAAKKLDNEGFSFSDDKYLDIPEFLRRNKD